ncbi:sensor histidine kinase [Nocardia yamanashiensis]|uniref:sensor histidine kinase n=1 Tax=Nocardia yamanashiensis TaxID=209247 RepID=UPI0022B847AB|nr:nitrate- and nitrite sensing domain-containing protein [Nocardia yamanashiensis]
MSVTLVLALLGLIIAGEVQKYRDTGATAHSVDLALAAQDLVHEVQRERGLTNGLLGGDNSLRDSVTAQRAAVDAALQQLNRALAEEAPGSDQVRTALSRLSGVSANRADVDARRSDRSTSFSFYTNAILALNQARPGAQQADDDSLWRGLQTLYALGEVKEFTAQERGFLNGVFAAGEFGGGEYVQFLDIRAGKQAAISAFERDATPGQRSQLYSAMRSDDSVRAAESEAVAIGSVRGPLLEPVDPRAWWKQMSSVIDAERGVKQSVGSQIRDRAAELRGDAAMVLTLYVLAALFAVAAQVGLVVATVRAIVRPLAALAEEADAVAEERLPQLIAAWHADSGTEPPAPEPVRAAESAGEEIVSVAHALDRVQTTAYELASAQARLRRNTTESMANLARRNQNLVRRQLGLISDFEREELDPNALSNLFELDHLATRMRRNAESLLVLVGESAPRRWAKPIPLTDVIRAGLSEVDDYRRVVLRRVDEISIAGASVSELAHMLAELIENGLSFSPPDLEVEIYGRRIGPRYMIAVVDHGVGMPPDQLATANARLRGEADFLVAPTRFLGHFVVGRLARRLGIEVELTVSPTSGVVARMTLPADLLADPNAPAPSFPVDAKHAAAPPVQDALTAPDPTGRHRSAPVAPGPADPFALGDPFDTAVSADQTPAGITNGALVEPATATRPDYVTGSYPIPVSDNPIKLVALPDPVGDDPDGRRGPTDRTVATNGRVPSSGPAGDAQSTEPGSSGRARVSAFDHPGTGQQPRVIRSGGADGGRSPGGPNGAAERRAHPGATGNPLWADDSRVGHDPFPPSDAAGGDAARGARRVPGDAEIRAVTNGVANGVAKSVPGVQRTRNGLVKRERKTRENSGATPGGAQPETGARPVAPIAERSPEAVRGMLAGFRAGHQRGERDVPPVPGSIPQEDRR